ncbi:MAG TPA: transporter [Thermoanaerobaculia bacterium]|nr:transporter [Thermoanaerobaculia bacterium]
MLAALALSDEPGIQDNSLLTEEAYNQEPAIVQHISLFQRDIRTHTWIYTFTQEWPAPAQKHQLSYTVPLQTGGRIGDVALNYRYQLAGNSDSKFAATPRFTLMLPTGDWRRGQGNGAVGYNVEMATSLAPVEQWNFHFDAGVITVPHSHGTSHALNLADNIVYRPAKRINFMVETVFNREDGQNSLLISPAVRWAYNYANGLQIVPAVGFPIGIGPSAGERAVILYLSFEHPFR